MRPLLLIALVACGGDSSGVTDAAIDSRAIDSSTFGTTCTGACQTTAVTAVMMATRTLDQAFYGVTASDSTLHVEVQMSGATGCPTMTSPTPSYSLILGRVPMPTSAAPSTSPGNFLDYEGDMLPGGALGAPATSVQLTPVAFQAGSFVALDVMLTFAAGTVTGHLYAIHCASLDTP